MPARSLLVTAVLGVLGAVLLVVLGLRVASDPKVQSSLGDEVFTVGRADRLAERVAEDGPLLFQDPLGKGRHIYVGHEGRDDAKGWFAVATRGPGGCALHWEGVAFTCGAGRVKPSDARLRRYPTKVENGQVIVDLRPRPVSTSSR